MDAQFAQPFARADPQPGLPRPDAIVAQTLARPGRAWDVGFNGRTLSLGNLGGIVGANAPLGDFLGWFARNFGRAAMWTDLAWVRALARGS